MGSDIKYSIMTELVKSVDELDEDEKYKFKKEDGESGRFRVELSEKDRVIDSVGEGIIQLIYEDGYVADVPVSNVEQYIEDQKILRIENEHRY